jgi:hypothetical protein
LEEFTVSSAATEAAASAPLAAAVVYEQFAGIHILALETVQVKYCMLPTSVMSQHA